MNRLESMSFGRLLVRMSDWNLQLDRATTRLSFLSHEFPPLGGGAASALDALTAELVRRGQTVQIVTIGVGRQTSHVVDEFGRHVVRLGVGRHRVLAPSATELAHSYWALRFRTHSVIKDFMPDVLTAYFAFPAGRAALHLGRRLKVPVIVSLRGSDVPGFSDSRWGPFRHTHGCLVRPVWKQCNLLMANGNHLTRLASKFVPGTRVVNFPNGVDTQMYRPPVPQTQEGTLRILFVGQWIQRKRCCEVVHAVRWLAARGVSAKLTMVGDGPLRSQLTVLSKRSDSKIQIELTGPMPRDRMPEIYRDHDVLVHLSRAEGVSNVLLEALASGLCVVCTRAVVDDLDDDSNEWGTFVKTADAAEVGQKLLALATSSSKRRRMQSAARELARKHRWETTAESFEQYARSLVLNHTERRYQQPAA